MAVSFHHPFFAAVKLSGDIFVIKDSFHTQNYQVFSGGMMGNFFEDIFVLSVQIPPTWYGCPAPKV